MAVKITKVYEVFGVERIKNPEVINIIKSQQKSGYIAIGIPGREKLICYCAGIKIGLFAERKMEGADEAVLFVTLNEIMDLYEAIPQIIANETPAIGSGKTEETE